MPLPPLDFSRFPMLDMPGAKDAFTGAQLTQERLRDDLMNRIYGVQADYAQPMAEEALFANQFANQLSRDYGAREKEAGIGLTGAQARQAGATAQEKEIMAQILLEALGGGQGGQMGQSAPQSPMPSMQGAPQQMAPDNFVTQGMPAYGEQDVQEAMQQGMEGQQQMAPQQAQAGNPQYDQVIGNALGFKPISQLTDDGVLVTQYRPGGQFYREKIAPSVGEKAEQTETGKMLAQEKEKVLGNINSSYDKEPLFQELMQITNSPEFYRGTGDVGSRIRKLTNDKDVNAMAGRLNYLLGDIVNKASKQFGARLNQSEFKSLHRMIGSDSQNPYEIKSKVMLMNAMNKYDRQVNENYYRNLSQGMDRLDAKQAAYENADYSDIRNIVRMDDLAYKAAQKKGSDYGSVMRAATRYAEETGESVEDALKFLGKKDGK